MERPLGVGLRLLLGLLGAVALGAGLLVGATEVRSHLGSWGFASVLITVVCAVVALGGVTLLRGAIRGRIAVRRNSR